MKQYFKDNYVAYITLVVLCLAIWGVVTVSRRMEQHSNPELQSIRQQQLQIVCEGSRFDHKRTDSRCK